MSRAPKTVPTELRLSAGYEARAPRWTDLEEVLALVNRVWRAVEDREPYSREQLRAEWEDPSFDLETEGLVVVDASKRIVAWEEVYDHSGHVRLAFDGGAMVDPAHRGHGLETALIRWAERTAQRHVARAPANRRVTLRASLNARDEASRTTLCEMGFAEVRRFLTMRIRLQQRPDQPEWPAGVSVRSMRPGIDEERYLATKREAFRDHWGAIASDAEEDSVRFRYWLDRIESFDPSLFRAATVGDEIAGICFALPTHDGDPEEAWVEDLGVLRPWRRRGIARALLQDAFCECWKRGKRAVGLAVDADSPTGATALYEQTGMKVVRRYVAHQKTLREGTDSEEVTS